MTWARVAPSPSAPGLPSFPGYPPGLSAERLLALLPYVATVVAGFIVLVVLVVVLRKAAPRVYWWTVGWPLLLLVMRRSWRRLMLNAELTGTDRPNTGQLGSLIVKGRPAVPLFPVLFRFRPRSFGATAKIGMIAGQTPDAFVAAADAMAHAWRMHAVRVASGQRGVVELTILNVDPLADSSGRAALAHKEASVVEPATPEDLRAEVGRREDGGSWVLDLTVFPHWLIAGATQSGKSTLINAAVMTWATRPVALVGIDCKGGMELAPHVYRLSALACDRNEAAEILTQLVAEARRRMALCREQGARNIWRLPADVRPVPVIVIVDELAELYLVAGREEKEAALRATTNLLRLAQLGAALGIHLIVAGQRIGSDLGPGVTALRAQCAGRICLKVHDSETAKMTLEDLYPDAVQAAQAIRPEERGVAVTTADDYGWIRARSTYLPPEVLDDAIAATAHLTPTLPGLTPPSA